MDVRVEAGSMESSADITVSTINTTISLSQYNHGNPTASLSLTPNIPSIGGHSISAVTPDFELLTGGLATA